MDGLSGGPRLQRVDRALGCPGVTQVEREIVLCTSVRFLLKDPPHYTAN